MHFKKYLIENKIYTFIKNRKSLFFVLCIILFFIFGVYIGFYSRPEIIKVTNVENKEGLGVEKINFDPFWKTWNVINEKYPYANKINDKEKLHGAISGLVKSLNDPYSSFLNPEDTKNFQEEMSGSFSGVGMEVGIKDKMLTVVAPLKNTPAERAGIKPGDKILKIDQIATSDMTVEKAVSLIRGKAGTPVVLTIYHTGEKESRDIKIIREKIDLPTIDTEIIQGNIFVIKIYGFSSNSGELFRQALKKFSESNADKLILDLRGNPGGYLDSAVSMASWFLPGGKPVVIEDFGEKIKQKIHRSAGYNIFNEKLKMVVLINSGSASASEILAGALQDYKKAKLVGEKSFGKGSVQEVIEITPDTVLKITVAKWLTPKGTSISEKGLTPDYTVPISTEDVKNKIDPQLNKAVEVLNNWK